MRLYSAAIGPYEEIGLEVIAEMGAPTVVLGPNNSGKSRLLDVLEALFESHRPEYRHITSTDIEPRRVAAQRTVDALAPSLAFELDQLALPGSWDREFFALHVGPHMRSPGGEAAQITPEQAVALALGFLAQEDDSQDDPEPTMIGQFDERTKAEYLDMLETAMRACRFVVTQAYEGEWPLAHWPALISEEIPDETWNLAASLFPRMTEAWSGAFGPVWELPGYALMNIASQGRRPAEPFSPGLMVCDENSDTTCTFPDFEIIRFGPNSPSIGKLLDDIAAAVLDQEGVLRPERLGVGPGSGVYGIGDSVLALRHDKVLSIKEEELSDLLALHTPEFAAGTYAPKIKLQPEFLGDREIRLRAVLTDDPETQVGSGVRNWYAYALARVAAEVRRHRRLVSGYTVRDPSVDRSVTTERPLLLLLDEPEAHLHMSMQQQVANWVAEESLKGNETVVVATHAPAFLSVPSPARRFLPLIAGRGQDVPEEAEGLLALAGASGGDLVATVRGFLFLEGRHEVDLYRACFDETLRENNIHLVPGSGAFGAAGQCAFLSIFGKRIAVILDRVRPEVAKEKLPWNAKLDSNEETEVQKIYGMDIANVKCIPFRPHDVIQAIPEKLIQQALEDLQLRPSTTVWKWADVEKDYDEALAEWKAKTRKGKKPDFKRIFLKHLGLDVAHDLARRDRLDFLVEKVCLRLRDGASPPTDIKIAFSQAMHFLEGREDEWEIPKGDSR